MEEYDFDIDFGNYDCDIDLNAFELTEEESAVETRYNKPKFTPIKSKFVCYEHAKKTCK